MFRNKPIQCRILENLDERKQVRAILSATRVEHEVKVAACTPPPCMRMAKYDPPQPRLYFECRPYELRLAAFLNLGALTCMLNTGGRYFIITTQGDEELKDDEIVHEEDYPDGKEAQAEDLRQRRLQAGVSSDEQSEKRKFLFPVFCTADIPNTTLEDFLLKASDFLEWPRRMSAIRGDFLGFVVMQSTSTDGINAPTSIDSSRCPSPNLFLSKTPREIHALWLQHIRPGISQLSFWSTCTFAILDERTLRDNTVLLCTDHSEVLETVRCDFDTALWHIVPLETMSLAVEDVGWLDDSEPLGTEGAEREDDFCRRRADEIKRSEETSASED